jgi:hypothetical protein
MKHTPEQIAQVEAFLVDMVRRGWVERAGGSTDPDKLVTALEATDHVGTMGRIQFYGRDNQFTHAMKYGLGLVTKGILTNEGKAILVLHLSAGHTQTCLPLCHPMGARPARPSSGEDDAGKLVYRSANAAADSAGSHSEYGGAEHPRPPGRVP